MGKEKKDIGPVILKFGLALALSLGGMLYSFLRNKKIKPSQSPPDLPKPSDCSNQVNSGRGSWASRNDHHALQKTPSSCNLDFMATNDKQEELHHPNNSIPDLSPSSRSNGDKDAYLLPEFNDLVKEFDLAAIKANMSPRKDIELLSDKESPRGHSRVEREGQEQEIKSLRNLVLVLKERERNLEIQLLEYCGLKEQETAVMELQNRLKLNNMEARLFALKIESLQADNRRLEAQVADYTKVVAELEAARAKIKVLKRKIRTEAEQNKEQILALKQRVQKMQEEEHKRVGRIDPEIQFDLHKLKDLETEVNELRKSNHMSQLEKSDLAQRLERVQILATSVLEDEETEKLKEESQRLRKQNEDLSKEIERIQADRCADVEELVYLKWINACLRYELRNYQPGPGKTIARDLSKTLSPKSEEKAKQLILEYANKEGVGEKVLNIPEPDIDQWSSSQASVHTDSGEFDESSIDDPSPRKSHNKFFGKLMKVLRGKDGHHHHHHHHHDSHSRNSSLERAQSTGEEMNSYGDSSFGHFGNPSESFRLRSSCSSSSKHSLDSQRSNRRLSDVGGPLGIYKRIDAIAESGAAGCSISPSTSDGQKSELVKYAEVLKGSRRESISTSPRRSSSFSSF